MKKKKEEIHLRKKYVDQSRQFLAWVNTYGFEQSSLGRLLYRLNRRFNLKSISLLFLYTLLLSFLIFYDFSLPYNVSVGEIASSDIKSPLTFQMVDEVATEQKRVEAEKALPLVFDYRPNLYEPVYTQVYQPFREMRELVQETHWPNSEYAKEEVIKSFLKHKESFVKGFGINISDRLFEWLVEKKFSVRIENILIRAISNWSKDRIIDLPKSALSNEKGTYILRDIEVAGDGEKVISQQYAVTDLKNLRDKKYFSIKGIRGVSGLSSRDYANTQVLVRKLMRPNLTLNQKEMAERRAKARESVLPVQVSIKKNQIIVREGGIVQSIHVTILDEIRSLKSKRRVDLMSLLSAFLFMTLILVFFSYLQRFTEHRVVVSYKDISVMGFVTVCVVLMTKFFLFITDAAFLDKYGSLIPATVFLYSAPVAAGPMLVGLLITSGEVVWIFTLFLATVLSLMVDFNFVFLIVTVISGIAGARGVYSCVNRNNIYFAGLRTGAINMGTIILVTLLTHKGEADLLRELLWNAPSGFLGGVLASLVAMMFIPMIESLFGYTTDVKLLELSNLNHPVMQELMMKAPGTYHHCMAVGTMCDAAAKAIGANALLAKVMAYYHDIGKMEHSQYFVENQQGGYNPHDHISPHMSKTILVAHVKDGAEMALKHKLGRPILDGILQHHGTSLITYFYNKAVEDQDEHTGQVEESEFRYPGPKPQFKEAALVMLADAIEATARSLDEPTPARLQNIVKNIIQSKFIDGQLDECNLTLKDLSIIEKSFRHILLSIYHQRMEYPHMKDGKVVSVAKPKNKKGSSTA